jgi:hypothetical protein
MIPIQNDKPWVFHPGSFEKVVKTFRASSLGPRVNNGIRIPKKPKM